MSEPGVPAPGLPGYTYLGFLGRGGFADVFLYEQHRPRRKVAIKVLRAPAMNAEAQRRFDAEADLMATVSHPYIVTVHDTAVAPDKRPYLVMAYYPGRNFAERMHDGELPVADVLRVGIQVASAVETAHRSDIIHGDIKPANILTSEYGHPGLTDFGISTLQTDLDDDSAVGFSIHYAPQELIEGDSRPNVQSDVYSLAATVYALLARRAPFERPGRNDWNEVQHRVLNEAPAGIGRADMPPALELVLRQALSKRPGDRHSSALAFARALRAVEVDAHLTQTDIIVPGWRDEKVGRDPRPVAADKTRHKPAVIDPDAGEKTRNKPAIVAPDIPDAADKTQHKAPVIDPHAAKVTPTRPVIDDVPKAVPERAGPNLRAASDSQPALDRTILREDDSLAPAPPPPPRRGVWIVVGVGAALVAIIAIVGALVSGGGGSASTNTTINPGAGETLPPAAPPKPTDVKVKLTNGNTVALVTWNEGGSDTEHDSYIVSRLDTGDVIPVAPTSKDLPSMTFKVGGKDRNACVQVRAIRAGSESDPSKAACP